MKVLVGDLFSSEAQTLVNTVNCVGIMGKGVALEFKKRFPDMYKDYVVRCTSEQVQLGKPYIFRQLMLPWVLNFPTKQHWRSVSKLEDIIHGLEYLKEHYKEWGITSLAVPPLGCGQGQLEWRIVGPTLYSYLSQLDIPVELYAPLGTPEDEIDTLFLSQEKAVFKNNNTSPISKVSPAWVALVAILVSIEREPYHWPVGRTTLQKIAYFATTSGLPTGLEYERGSYGPFASSLKSSLSVLINNGLIREVQRGRMFSVELGTTYKDAFKIYRNELAEWKPIIRKVADLFLRMKTQDAEIAATVHFAAQELTSKTPNKPSESAVFIEVKHWKQKRRPPLDDKDIGEAIRMLNVLHWLDLQPSNDLPISKDAATLF